MNYEPQPIQVYLTQRYMTSVVQKIVDGWRIEPQLVVDKMLEHFREMGIFVVPFKQDELIIRSLIRYLRTSPDIARLVQRSRSEELRRQRNRHSE